MSQDSLGPGLYKAKRQPLSPKVYCLTVWVKWGYRKRGVQYIKTKLPTQKGNFLQTVSSLNVPKLFISIPDMQEQFERRQQGGCPAVDSCCPIQGALHKNKCKALKIKLCILVEGFILGWSKQRHCLEHCKQEFNQKESAGTQSACQCLTPCAPGLAVVCDCIW